MNAEELKLMEDVIYAANNACDCIIVHERAVEVAGMYGKAFAALTKAKLALDKYREKRTSP